MNDATSFSPEKVQVQAQSIGVPVGAVIVWTKEQVPDGPGEVKEAGLPNITGRYDTFNIGVILPLGKGLSKRLPKVNIAADIASLGRGLNVIFDASMSNPIYGKSNTVQPPAVTVKYIIKAE